MIWKRIMFLKARLLIPIILITVLFSFFNKIIFKDKVFIPGDFLRSDTLNQNLPFKYTFYENLKQNKFPLWINTITAGYPLAAEGQTGVFYPLNIIFFKILPFFKAYNLLILINFIILSLGTYLFTMEIKISRYGSILAAIVYPLSSFFILHLTHQNILAASSWLPLIYYANIKYFKSKNWNYFFLGIILISLSILAGSIQITFYLLFSLLIFLLIFSNLFTFNKKKIIGLFFIQIFASLLLCSIQLIPTFELMLLSVRSQGLGSVALNSLPYHVRNLITFLSPYVFGDPGLGTYPRFGGSWGMFWENTGYIGLIPLFLAITTLKSIKNNKNIKFYWILLTITLLMALGKYSPLFWIYHLPIFNYFRVTSRFLVILLFYLTILSAFGFDNLISHFKDNSNKIIISLFIFIFVLFDLFVFGYNYNPVINTEEIFNTPQNAEFIKSQDDQARLFSIASTLKYDEINKKGWRNNSEKILFHKNALDPDINILWNLKSIDGYIGLNLLNSNQFMNEVYSGISFDQNKLLLSNEVLKLLGFAGVKYLISPYELENNVKLTFETKNNTDQYLIYQNPYYYPRGIIVDNLEAVNQPIDTSNIKIKNLSKTKDEQDQIVFELYSDQPAWFVLQDTYYPGWEVYVNGMKSQIYKAREIFRAVEVPQGKSTIEFKYHPKSFIIGTIISLISFLSLFSFWLFFKYRNFL